MGPGGDENRGRRFQPGSSSHTQRLPLTARGGGWTQGCSVYPEGCMLRGNDPPRSQIFKNPQAPQPAQPPPLGQSSAAPQSAIRRRQEPGISHPRGLGVGVAAARARGAGRHPAVRSAAAGPGLRFRAAPPPGRRRPPAALPASPLSAAARSPPARGLSPSVPSPSVGVRASLPPSNAGNAQKTSEYVCVCVCGSKKPGCSVLEAQESVS